jgi:Ca-activated chloride channel family protein
LLLLVPLLVFWYRRSLIPPAASAVLHPDLATLARASAQRQDFTRHLPALFFLLAVILGIVALARPIIPILQADPRSSIVLALDVSRSMRATDVEPSRFEAAREALKVFIRELPQGARIGLVTFSRAATEVVAPTTDRQRLLDSVDLVQLEFGTAIGEGILTSLQALPPLEQRKDVKDPSELATIILLTDGRSISGIDPLEAARMAAEQKVRIHTIGVGRVTEGPVPGLEDVYQWAAYFDEGVLKQIAAITGGKYFFVSSAGKLRETYQQLSQSFAWKVRQDEASGMVTLGAGIFLLGSLILSQLRRQVA